jgi:beta-glucosidase
MLATCHEHGLTPMLSFHHFTSPRWLIAEGGWQDARTPDRFARFCATATRYLGDLIGAACTLNEPNLGRLLVNAGALPPREQLEQAPGWVAAARAFGILPQNLAPFQLIASPAAVDVLIASHHRAVEAIKSGPGDFPVGFTLAVQDIQAAEGGEERAAQARREVNDVFLEAAREDDFLGVQSYSRQRIGPKGALGPEPGVELTQMGYEFWPQALEASIRYAHSIAEVPIIVTENGIATADDARRITFVRRALQGVARCLEDGLDVRGYLYWSAFDNFEWTRGYEPTFGLIGVDRETQARTVKPSARWLGQVARANALPSTTTA